MESNPCNSIWVRISCFLINYSANIQLGTGQAPALSAAVATDAGYLLTSDLGAVNTNVQ